MVLWGICVTVMSRDGGASAVCAVTVKERPAELVKLEHTQKQYYHFQTRQKIGKEGYERWAQALLAKQYAV